MKRLTFLFLLSLLTFPALATDEEMIVASFKEFAQTESGRLADTWLKISAESLDKSTGQRIPLSAPPKCTFYTLKIESAPPTYDIDIKRTDSLIDPYLGYIKFPLVFLRSLQYAKDPSESCDAKPLDECLEGGGELYESALMYRPTTQRLPQVFVYEYTYQDGRWVPKTNFEAAFQTFVASLNLINPVPQATSTTNSCGLSMASVMRPCASSQAVLAGRRTGPLAYGRGRRCENLTTS